MGSQGENSENCETRDLEFGEVLHLLSRKAVLGAGLPQKYNHPPWTLPENQATHETINTILKYSIKVQSGHVPGSDEFQNFILSNSSLAVAGLLQYYLSQIQIQSEIVFGILLWDESARSGPDDYEGTPHIWLSVDSSPVDNTHVAFPPSADNLEYFYECKKMNSYLRENPLETSMRLFLGHQEEKDEDVEVLRHNLRVLQTYSYSLHIKKYLALSLWHAELNPGVKLYHIMMLDFIKTFCNITPASLENTMAKECWACRKEWASSDDLKTCTVCKVAKYCDRNCQRQEWKVHKLLHKELEHTKKLLEENCENEEEPEI